MSCELSGILKEFIIYMINNYKARIHVRSCSLWHMFPRIYILILDISYAWSLYITYLRLKVVPNTSWRIIHIAWVGYNLCILLYLYLFLPNAIDSSFTFLYLCLCIYLLCLYMLKVPVCIYILIYSRLYLIKIIIHAHIRIYIYIYIYICI